MTWAEVGAAVLEVAEREWRRPVVEPSRDGKTPAGARRINEYIRGALGLGWPTAQVGVPSVAYTRNGQFAWCGAFASYCWGAGAGLRPDLRRLACPSTFRLWELARQQGRTWKRCGSPLGDCARTFLDFDRGADPAALLPGDVLVVGPDPRHGAKAWGSHVALVRSVDYERGEILTIEGNTHGVQPDGEVREGVVHQVRPIWRPGLAPDVYRARFVLRWAPGDLVSG